MSLGHRVIAKIIRRLRVLSIRAGIIKGRQIGVGGEQFYFHDVARSTLLTRIAVDGFEAYEPEVVTFLNHYPFSISHFIDAGANIGFYSILATVRWPKVRVVAVEPFPKNIRYIEQFQQTNDVSFEVIPRALHDTVGEDLTLYVPAGRSSSALASSASLINKFQGTEGIFNQLPYEVVTVQSTTLAEVLVNSAGPALIKLDCEGSELRILRTSAELLQRQDLDFIVEILINDERKDELFSLFREQGYTGYLITNSGLVREDRPLTFPNPSQKNRTIWKNHYFTKRDAKSVRDFSLAGFGYWV